MSLVEFVMGSRKLGVIDAILSAIPGKLSITSLRS